MVAGAQLRAFVGVVVERLGRLIDDRMRQICAALEVAVACET